MWFYKDLETFTKRSEPRRGLCAGKGLRLLAAQNDRSQWQMDISAGIRWNYPLCMSMEENTFDNWGASGRFIDNNEK